MNWIREAASFLTTEPVAALANVSSIVGLCITLIVMFVVWEIRQRHDSLVRLPEIKAQLEERSSALSALLNDFEENTEAIASELARLEPVLKAVKKRLPLFGREAVNDALRKIAAVTDRVPTDNLVRGVYRSLQRILGDLYQRERDSMWRI